jgi:hypothetical protein
MGAVMIGTCLGVTRQERGSGDKQFTATTIHVLDGVHKYELDVVRDFRGPLPGQGEIVAIDVFASAWVGRNGSGNIQWRAAGRNSEIEALGLAAPATV